METTALDKVLIDTSVWISFFRKQEPCYETVGGLIDEGRICCCGLILAELLQGAKSTAEQTILADFPAVFDFIREDVETWANAGRLSCSLRQKGITIGLADCFIAVAAATNGVPLATLDKHFGELAGRAGLKLFPLSRDS
ncbi:MAG: PIN domain-containing protein [Thermodesulfobacteriota bacterium]